MALGETQKEAPVPDHILPLLLCDQSLNRF